MIDKTLFEIFKKGSKTYFYTSLFFPHSVRKDVFSLYSFVRTADDFVDSIPQQKDNFYKFWADYQTAKNKKIGNIVIDSFVELEKRKDFNEKWTESFLKSMEMDLSINTYSNQASVDEYMYGSAEVVGRYMAKILELPEEAYCSAKYLGKAMQYMNFIRDVAEDLSMGRSYFPKEDFEYFGLKSLDFDYVSNNKDKFSDFINFQINKYNQWQKIAEEGFQFIPKKYLIPIKTASEMYKWTSRKISQKPMIIYSQKVKPSVMRIVSSLFLNSFSTSRKVNT